MHFSASGSWETPGPNGRPRSLESQIPAALERSGGIAVPAREELGAIGGDRGEQHRRHEGGTGAALAVQGTLVKGSDNRVDGKERAGGRLPPPGFTYRSSWACATGAWKHELRLGGRRPT